MPCVFAEEDYNKADPKFGFITSITHRQGKVRIDYEIIEASPFLTWEDLSKPPVFDFDIDKLEMNRTHWAVKDVDLNDELLRRGIKVPKSLLDSKKGTDSGENERTVVIDGEKFTYRTDKPLGKAGYKGAVFEGTNSEGLDVAVKRLNLSWWASPEKRELEIVGGFVGHTLKNVIPITACGRDETGNAFIVMPLAEKSLEDAIESSGIDEGRAKNILAQVANGLIEIGNVIHRDLKPANILRHDRMWKIADFGISKITGQETASSTHKLALSPPYASPERWNEETATSASDVYSIGCLAHALLKGGPPFAGPDREDYKRQHCRETPPNLTLNDISLSLLVAGMLSKASEARPSLQTIACLGTNVSNSEELAPAFAMLADAGLAVANASAFVEAETIERNAKNISRKTIAADGYRQLRLAVRRFQ